MSVVSDGTKGSNQRSRRRYFRGEKKTEGASAQQRVLLSELVIGEPDANIEQTTAWRLRVQPIFQSHYYPLPNYNSSQFISGEKTFVLGQKGTGKTALLRNLQHQCASIGLMTEFIVFKSSILEETDLIQESQIAIFDDKKAAQAKHYYHMLKRLVLLLIASRSKQGAFDESSDLSDDDRGLLSRIVGQDAASAIKNTFDSILSTFKAISIDMSNATGGKVDIDVSRKIKSMNDSLSKAVLQDAKRNGLRLRIFFDEVHFSYQSADGQLTNAMLVRDLLHVCTVLNSTFAEQQIDVILYAAVRSEFLMHPVIKELDSVHTVESASFSINWHEYPFNRDHPLFKFIAKRLVTRDGGRATNPLTVLSGIDPGEFLSHTWAKPRDFVRFFRTAQALYPERWSLDRSRVKTVLNKYGELSWSELLASLASFIPQGGRVALENYIRRIAPHFLDGSSQLTVEDFADGIEDVYLAATAGGSFDFSREEFVEMLYVLGLFSTEKSDRSGQRIEHAYHRGNRSPQMDGKVRLHRAIQLAFG
ncbi:P-loop ATPase, Sll1717 family [Tabrizicola sp.]|uniref:P-loop ATPase, Sll1717 family n=1 Tax=Tabrizicola sp. TaxID=2005166 RepID=UPI0035B09186